MRGFTVKRPMRLREVERGIKWKPVKTALCIWIISGTFWCAMLFYFM
jgi:hypothetical protein